MNPEGEQKHDQGLHHILPSAEPFQVPTTVGNFVAQVNQAQP